MLESPDNLIILSKGGIKLFSTSSKFASKAGGGGKMCMRNNEDSNYLVESTEQHDVELKNKMK